MVTRIFAMSLPASESRSTEITVIVVLISILILLPPMLGYWGDNSNPWYIPYLAWASIITLSYFLQRLLRKYAV